MSYQDGWAAINLEMPDRIPRTEYSAETHWRLVEQVTGIRITKESTEQERLRASSSFRKAWDYGYRWHVYTDKRALLKCHTSMGHAEYAEGGSDFDTDIQCPFEDPEELLDFQPQEVYGSLDHRVLVREITRITRHASGKEQIWSIPPGSISPWSQGFWKFSDGI